MNTNLKRFVGFLALTITFGAMLLVGAPGALAGCPGDYCSAFPFMPKGECTVLCSLNGARGTLHLHLCWECGRPYYERHVACNCP